MPKLNPICLLWSISKTKFKEIISFQSKVIGWKYTIFGNLAIDHKIQIKFDVVYQAIDGSRVMHLAG
jgi:transposase